MLNSHIHLFRDVDVPRDFLRFKLCQVMDNPIGYFIVNTLLHNIIPFTNKDKLDRYACFVDLSKQGNIDQIFANCAMHYPKKHSICGAFNGYGIHESR